MRASSERHASPRWRRPLEAAGLGLLGALAPERYDARVPRAWRCASLLPAARTALVVGSAGRALFDAFRASSEACDGAPDPLDRFVRAAVDGACAELQAAGHAARAFAAEEQRGDAFADLVALGHAAGLGWPSRLALLLHPVHGPWISLRAVVLTSLEPGPALPLAAPLSGSGPCAECPAPCASVCRGAAIRIDTPPGAEAFLLDRCAETRRGDPHCAERCDARRACPVGVASAYDAAAEAHHMRAAAGLMAARVAPG